MRGEFYFQDANIEHLNGVRSPNVTYRVEFNYLNNHFTVINRTGTAYVATIHCKLSNNLKPIPFRIGNITHFENLFFRKKSRLRLETNDEILENFILENEHFKTLDKIALKDKFSPVIYCENDFGWKLITEYHLEFDNWTEPVNTIIDFYIDLITNFK